MQLSFMIDNTIFRETSRNIAQKNILYEPKNSLVDNILYTSDDNYFIVDNGTYNTNTDNVLNLPVNHVGFYNYHCLVSHSIEKHINDPISASMHIPILFIIDQLKTYKKEDKHILQQKSNQHTKLFLNKNSFNYFGGSKSILVNIGIPLESFVVSTDYLNRKDVVVFDSGPVSQQLKFALEKESISCTVINNRISLKTINYILNSHKICIDISENYLINSLVGMSCGCRPLTSANNQPICEFIRHIDLNDNLISAIKTELSAIPDHTAYREYIKEQYSFEAFQKVYKQLINDISHEVYIK